MLMKFACQFLGMVVDTKGCPIRRFGNVAHDIPHVRRVNPSSFKHSGKVVVILDVIIRDD